MSQNSLNKPLSIEEHNSIGICSKCGIKFSGDCKVIFTDTGLQCKSCFTEQQTMDKLFIEHGPELLEACQALTQNIDEGLTILKDPSDYSVELHIDYLREALAHFPPKGVE